MFSLLSKMSCWFFSHLLRQFVNPSCIICLTCTFVGSCSCVKSIGLNFSLLSQYVNDVRTMQKRLQDAEEFIVFINKEEALYKWDQTVYPEVENIKENLESYQKLFSLVLKWHKTEKRCVGADDLPGDSFADLKHKYFYRSVILDSHWIIKVHFTGFCRKCHWH